jgi:hypothetical protein
MDIRLLHYHLHIGERPVLKQLEEEIHCRSLEEVDRWRDKIMEQEGVDKVFLTYSMITKPEETNA